MKLCFNFNKKIIFLTYLAVIHFFYFIFLVFVLEQALLGSGWLNWSWIPDYFVCFVLYILLENKGFEYLFLTCWKISLTHICALRAGLLLLRVFMSFVVIGMIGLILSSQGMWWPLSTQITLERLDVWIWYATVYG